MEFVPVCPADLEVEEVRLVHVGDERIALIRLEDGYHALSDTCSHMGGFLSDGWIEDDEIVCAWHNGWFDVRSGRATMLPAKKPVYRYAVRVSEGQVWMSTGPIME